MWGQVLAGPRCSWLRSARWRCRSGTSRRTRGGTTGTPPAWRPRRGPSSQSAIREIRARSCACRTAPTVSSRSAISPTGRARWRPGSGCGRRYSPVPGSVGRSRLSPSPCCCSGSATAAMRVNRVRRLRGAELVDARELRRRVRPPHRRLAARFSMSPGPEPYLVAGVPYPERAETQHTIVSGTTGSGKTVLDLRSRGPDPRARRALRDLRQDGLLHARLLRSGERHPAQPRSMPAARAGRRSWRREARATST